MALKPCRECGQPISGDAKACPHCGKRPTASRNAIGCLILVAVFILIALIDGQSKNAPPAGVTAANDARGERQDACEEAIKGRLKTPTTAQFSDWSESVTGKGRYLIRVNVASQNTFGAMLTGLGVCEIRHDTLVDVRVASR